jgi:hypothetical protein
VLVGWTVHLAREQVHLRASLWQQHGSGWQEVRLPAHNDAEARAVTCSDDACTVVGSVAGRLAVWRVRGSQVRALAAPDVSVGEREPVLATSTGSAVWLAVGDGTTTHVLRLADGRFETVPPPPGLVTSLAGLPDGVVAVVRAPSGSTAMWRAR